MIIKKREAIKQVNNEQHEVLKMFLKTCFISFTPTIINIPNRLNCIPCMAKEFTTSNWFNHNNRHMLRNQQRRLHIWLSVLEFSVVHRRCHNLLNHGWHLEWVSWGLLNSLVSTWLASFLENVPRLRNQQTLEMIANTQAQMKNLFDSSPWDAFPHHCAIPKEKRED